MTSQSVLVGVDFSATSLDAARWAARYLAPGAPLALAHAVYLPQPPSFLRSLYPPVEPVVEDARRGAEVRLRELADGLGRDADLIVRVGRPDDTLRNVAQEIGAGILVVGARGERGGVWRLFGSTAERVARQAPCALLLARALPAGPMRRALVTVDDSEAAGAVLDWAAKFSGVDAERMVLLHVVSGALTGAVRMGAQASEAREAERKLREHAEEWLHGLAAAAGLANATVEVRLGDAAMEILRAADRHAVDVVVVGQHGAGHGMFLGSTAEFVLRQGSGPVMLAASR
ncbi:MAG TPA: universal stress protein [Gemmatimonadaceae bacterium]|nr:universal stress protein [Gemmatimonadaceae bacterium]